MPVGYTGDAGKLGEFEMNENGRDRSDRWTCALELDDSRSITAGRQSALRDAIRRGADLRIYTEFRHNEHIDPASDDTEVVREVAEFKATYLVDERWVAGIMTMRQPVELPDGFGQPPSMSFFMYNEDGRQAIARPYLDDRSSTGIPDLTSVPDDTPMARYHRFSSWDADTNAPSHNFVYDFDVFRFWVCDNWREVLAHDRDGTVSSGSIDALAHAFSNGAEVKVGIGDLCHDLAEEQGDSPCHEVFIQLNSCYYYTDQKLFIGATDPLVRVRPVIPMEYSTGGWDFGWLVVRTDGHAALRLADPYTLKFRDAERRYAVRWFVR